MTDVKDDIIQKLQLENAELQQHIQALKDTVAKLQRMLFGQKSEKVIANDAQMLLPGMEDLFAEKKAAPEEKSHVEAHERTKPAGQPKAGWNGFPEELPREELVVDVPENEREGLEFAGFETSERLVRRNEYVVQVVKRKKYAKPNKPSFGVVTAPAPAVPSCFSASSDRCHYDVSVIVHVIAEKLIDAIPFYRQSEMFARIGISFGRSAMCDYFIKASNALAPLFDEMTRMVMACEILHADETTVKMLYQGKTKTCWIWVRKTGLGPPMTVFHFAQDRSKATAHKILGNYEGTILRDGCPSYNDLPAEAAGCWAHCRRKFFDAQDNSPEYAHRALELIRQLYLLERQAKEEAVKKDGETALFKMRKRVRSISAGYVDSYFDLCHEILGKEPPSSAIAKAAFYSSDREKELRRFLADARLNIDNNPCENVIRPFCIGRKNWLFVGNENGGTSMATLASFAATCKDNGVNFEEWLADVLVRIDTIQASRITELLPHLWKQLR